MCLTALKSSRAISEGFSNVLKLIEKHRPTSVYHIVAMLGPSCGADPEAGIHANALGTYYVLKAARLFGVKQVVFASSVSVLSSANPNDETVHDYSRRVPTLQQTSSRRGMPPGPSSILEPRPTSRSRRSTTLQSCHLPPPVLRNSSSW